MSRSKNDIMRFAGGGTLTHDSKQKHIWSHKFPSGERSSHKRHEVKKEAKSALNWRLGRGETISTNTLVQMSPKQYNRLLSQLSAETGTHATVNVRGRIADARPKKSNPKKASSSVKYKKKGAVEMQFSRSSPHSDWNHLHSKRATTATLPRSPSSSVSSR